MCLEEGYSEVQRRDILTLDIIFILYEAQQTYAVSHLWYSVIKTQNERTARPRSCLFSSYDSPITSSPNYLFRTTPVILSTNQRVSLTVSHKSDVCAVCRSVCRRPWRVGSVCWTCWT